MIEELNDIIEQTYYFEQKLYEWGKKVEKNKGIISKSMGKKDKVDVVVDEKTQFKAVKKITTNIDFFPDKLKTTLSKETYDKIIKKTVTVDDLNKLVVMLKSYGVPSKEFKKFITVASEIDVEEVDNLIEMGEINIEDIQGCYKVEFEEDIKVYKTK